MGRTGAPLTFLRGVNAINYAAGILKALHTPAGRTDGHENAVTTPPRQLGVRYLERRELIAPCYIGVPPIFVYSGFISFTSAEFISRWK